MSQPKRLRNQSPSLTMIDEELLSSEASAISNLSINKSRSNSRVDSGQSEQSHHQAQTILEHRMTIEEVCQKHQTSLVMGLSEKEALARLERDGLNAFTPPKTKPWYWLFFKELTTGFALLLWFAGFASFISYAIERRPEDGYLGGVLIFTVLISASFSYYQQASSSKVFNSFKKMAPQSTYVLRDGKKQPIPVEQLVQGDIVYCQAGDRVPADIRVIESNSMKVDNSSITGESEPLLRLSTPDNTKALEASNLAFFSTSCTDGSGIGIVISTGDRTVLGDIANIVSNIGEQKTPIAKEIAKFVKIITIFSVVSGLVFFGLAYYFGSSFFSAFLFMIGITVGNVPEGLPVAMTVCLTIAAKRMASKNCLVKHLEAVETLGSTSTICTDKTGTLTQNRMTVEHIWFGCETYQNRDQMMRHPEFEFELTKGKLDWLAMKRCAMLCSKAEFLDDNPNVDQRQCIGDASEIAIMKFLEQSIDSVSEYRALYEKVAEKPFSSVTKYQYSVHRSKSPINESFENYFLVMKGAPERIISKCNRRVDFNGQTIPIDDEFIEKFEETYRDYGSRGERVLAFCDHHLPVETYGEDFHFDSAKLDDQVKLENLRFLGLVSMIDPPRPSVPEAVRLCRKSGIRVVMVTGDHPITAQAIAKMVNIISTAHRATTVTSLRSTISVTENQRSIVVPGNELDEMTDQSLDQILMFYGEIVFARTSPQQKLRIVERFQAQGEIVAVTGDGVNDSPALKKADIGIAMGITGSEVSKQAADMILLDDNFATIVTGIEEGRRIFDNMKKTISYILAGNVTTIYPFVVYATLGYPLAISTTTALIIALGTDIVPAISLAYEKSESDIMNLPPRDAKKDRLVDCPLLERAYLTVGIIASSAAFFAYFLSMHSNGYTVLMLWNSRVPWNDKNDSFPRIHGYDHRTPIYVKTTYEERMHYQVQAQSAYFCGIIVVQWMDVVISKTRRTSIFRHGMGNWQLNFSLVFETVLAVLLVYTPQLNLVMQTAPVGAIIWIWALPFMGFVLLYEEIRKSIIRSYPKSYLGKHLLA